MARVRYLPMFLLAGDLAAMLTTVTVAIVTDTTAVRDVTAVLLAEFAIVILLFAAQLYLDRIWPADVPQPVHVITRAPAVTLTRLADPVHAGTPELVELTR